MEKTEVSITQVTVRTNIKEYLSEKETGAMSFHLYHYPEEKHLLPISKKIVKGSHLYITGHLSFVQGLMLVKLTQSILKTSPKARKRKPEPRTNTTKPKVPRLAAITLKNTQRIIDEDPKEESSQQAEEVVNVD
ncbi:hypothetical protein Glove_4g30 [Diversispora epigaea]|uniref:Uncharacterized protein n=1 Tax=Diversispora epigaea TaxID=1348612 RepID=A0A397JS34_9GLOM|nr:hypothetical protein Glove_4g30 [Diversispora epigaea]